MVICIPECLALSAVYVLVLYLIPHRIRKLPRDDLLHMRYRMAAVTVATTLSMLYGYWTLSNHPHAKDFSYFELIGLRLDNALLSIILTIGLMCVFYLGPLICQALVIGMNGFGYKVDELGFIRESTDLNVIHVLRKRLEKQYYSISRLAIIRNLIFAPITEELVFRSLLVPIYYLHLVGSNYPIESRNRLIIWTCPLYFGVAHFHHLYENIRMGISVPKAVVMALFQTTYTTIFGAVAVTLMLRTGNILAPITSHIFCNFQNLPEIGFMSPPGSGELSFLYRYRFLILFLHGLGLYLFYILLYPVTELTIDNDAEFSPFAYSFPLSNLEKKSLFIPTYHLHGHERSIWDFIRFGGQDQGDWDHTIIILGRYVANSQLPVSKKCVYKASTISSTQIIDWSHVITQLPLGVTLSRLAYLGITIILISMYLLFRVINCN